MSLDFNELSMRHGKKGFERIRWAFKNVLVHSICWLFQDLRDESPRLQADIGSKGIPEGFPVLVE